MKKILGLLTAIAMVIAALMLSTPAGASGNASKTCVPTPETTQVVVVTPEQVIQHPAVTHVETVVISEAVPALWANFSPNKEQGPFEGPPVWPTDPRGTWQIHYNDNGGPSGDTLGVFQQGEGHGSWFYRQLGADAVTEDRVVVDKEAWTEVIPAVTQTIVTPAVVCPTETPSVTPETPVANPEPTKDPEPTKNSEPDKDKDEPVKTTNIPKDVQVIACVNGVWTITVNGEVISESGTCGETPENTVPQTFSETGL